MLPIISGRCANGYCCFENYTHTLKCAATVRMLMNFTTADAGPGRMRVKSPNNTIVFICWCIRSARRGLRCGFACSHGSVCLYKLVDRTGDITDCCHRCRRSGLPHRSTVDISNEYAPRQRFPNDSLASINCILLLLCSAAVQFQLNASLRLKTHQHECAELKCVCVDASLHCQSVSVNLNPLEINGFMLLLANPFAVALDRVHSVRQRDMFNSNLAALDLKLGQYWIGWVGLCAHIIHNIS